jgi:hypothetical protein
MVCVYSTYIHIYIYEYNIYIYMHNTHRHTHTHTHNDLNIIGVVELLQHVRVRPERGLDVLSLLDGALKHFQFVSVSQLNWPQPS